MGTTIFMTIVSKICEIHWIFTFASLVILGLAVPDTITGSYSERGLRYRVFPHPYGQQ